jgi:hypothetical protein
MAFGFFEVTRGKDRFCLNSATVIYASPMRDGRTAIILRNVSDAATPMAGGQLVVDQPYEKIRELLMGTQDTDPYG